MSNTTSLVSRAFRAKRVETALARIERALWRDDHRELEFQDRLQAAIAVFLHKQPNCRAELDLCQGLLLVLNEVLARPKHVFLRKAFLRHTLELTGWSGTVDPNAVLEVYLVRERLEEWSRPTSRLPLDLAPDILAHRGATATLRGMCGLSLGRF